MLLKSMIWRSFAVLSALIVASMAPAHAQGSQAELKTSVDALLQESFEADGAGAVIVIAKDGKVIYRGAFGLADIESGTPISPDTVFRYASITKQFAAATALKLAEKGKLSLDDPLSKFLPDYPAPGNAVTVRQLLNHTSGIKSYTGIPGWMIEANTSRAFTTAELIAEFQDQPMDFEAGRGYRYNNSGYVLLGAVIEQVTGKPWYQAMTDELTDALGIRTISAFLDESSIANMATGYTRNAKGEASPSQKIHASVPGAAGALRGTADDLVRWTHALHSGELLSTSSYEAMIAPTVLPSGEVEDYGFGLVLTSVRGRPAIGHAGGIFGFATDVVHVPEAGVSVAMLANADQTKVPVFTLLKQAAAHALGDPFPKFAKADVDVAAVEPLFGTYAVSDTETRQFYARNGRLYTLRSGSSENEVFAAGEGRFFYGPDSLTWFEFGKTPDGKPMMQFHPNGASEPELAFYTGPVDVPEPVEVPIPLLQTYAGSYSTQFGDAVFAVSEAGALTLSFAGQPTTPLIALSENEFTVQGIDVRIGFAEEDDAMTMTLVQGEVTLKAVRSAE